MALKGIIACAVIFCFFRLGNATFCSVDRDCETWSGESCCSDSVCRKACRKDCSYNSDCGTGEVCCDGGDCLSACPSTSPPWTSAPITYCSFDYQCDTDEECCDGDCLSVCPSTLTRPTIGGAIVFFLIVIYIVARFWCAYSRHCSPGTVIVSQRVPYQQFVSTTHTTMSSMQQIPPPANYDQPPPPGYNQPPPRYPSYPQQPAQHPPPPPAPATGQPPMAPKVTA